MGVGPHRLKSSVKEIAGNGFPRQRSFFRGLLVVFLVWVYYSAQIFFLGAEFTHVFAGRHGSRAEQRAERAKTLVEARQIPRPKLA